MPDEDDVRVEFGACLQCLGTNTVCSACLESEGSCDCLHRHPFIDCPTCVANGLLDAAVVSAKLAAETLIAQKEEAARVRGRIKAERKRKRAEFRAAQIRKAQEEARIAAWNAEQEAKAHLPKPRRTVKPSLIGRFRDEPQQPKKPKGYDDGDD